MTHPNDAARDLDLRKLAKSLMELRERRKRNSERLKAGAALRPSQKLAIEATLKKIEAIRSKMLSMGANPDIPLPPAPPPPETRKTLMKKKRMVTPDPPNARRRSGGAGVYPLGHQTKFWKE